MRSKLFDSTSSDVLESDVLNRALNDPRFTRSLVIISLWISISLILRMWVLHRETQWLKKFFWSLVLLIPAFGWLFYGGCFKALTPIKTPCPKEHD
jgi:hypothetical protein